MIHDQVSKDPDYLLSEQGLEGGTLWRQILEDSPMISEALKGCLYCLFFLDSIRHAEKSKR